MPVHQSLPRSFYDISTFGFEKSKHQLGLSQKSHRLLLKPHTTFILDVTLHLASQDVFENVRILLKDSLYTWCCHRLPSRVAGELQN